MVMLEKILLIWLALAIMIWAIVAGVLLEKHIKIFKESLEKEEYETSSLRAEPTSQLCLYT